MKTQTLEEALQNLQIEIETKQLESIVSCGMYIYIYYATENNFGYKYTLNPYLCVDDLDSIRQVLKKNKIKHSVKYNKELPEEWIINIK